MCSERPTVTSDATAADPRLPGLTWPIKRSFIDYVFRMPDGGGWVTDGATATEDNVLVYEFVSVDEASSGQRWTFRGDVRFGGHGGLLFVRIADPVLTVVNNLATVSIIDPADEDGHERRVDLVTAELTVLDAPAGMARWRGDPVRLTAAGVPLFNDVYAEGELFDPLTVQLPGTPTS